MSKYDSDKFSNFFSPEDEFGESINVAAAQAAKNNSKKAEMLAMEAKIRKKLRRSKKLGIFLCVIQLILSAGLLFAVERYLPLEYDIIVGVVLGLLFVFTFALQFRGLTLKRVGKFFSVLVIIVSAVGLYLIIPTLKVTSTGTVEIGSEPFVIYLSGNDTFDELPTKSNGRSDTNIIAVVNPKTYTAVLISTPRDAYVELIGEDIPEGNFDKLTHAGTYGNGIKNDSGKWEHGCQVSMNILSDLYGVDVDSYLKLNFTGFANLIDALGGVTIDIPQGFSTYTYGKHYTFEEGTQTLNGEEALTYVRERKSFATGDIQRGANQVAVIKAIVKQAMSANTIIRYNEILDAVGNSFETDLKIDSLVEMQLDIQNNSDYDGWNIVNYSVTGGSYGQYMYCYSAEKNLSVVDLHEDSVEIAKTLAKMVVDGEKVTDKTIEKLKNGEEAEEAE